VDRIRDLGWPGVAGNTDEMLATPQSLEDFARGSLHLKPMWDAIREMAAFTREALGDDRLRWLRTLPGAQMHGPIALVHASPESFWRAPQPEATDAELETTYKRLDHPVAVYGHVHRPYIRRVGDLTVVNSGSVGLSYDGDRRAAYMVIDDGVPEIQRVEYDLDRELKLLAASGLPHADWVSKMLVAAAPKMP